VTVERDCTYTCPHCWQENCLVVEPYPAEQSFIQDCEVCCNPLAFHVVVEDGEVVLLDVTPSQ